MAKNDEVAHSFQPLMGAHGGQVADPVIEARKATSAPGARGETDEERRETRRSIGVDAQTCGNHGRGACARHGHGDGGCDVHGTPMAGGWSLVRRGRRPPRGRSQENRPLALGCCEWVHNVRQRGNALLPALMAWLVA